MQLFRAKQQPLVEFQQLITDQAHLPMDIDATKLIPSKIKPTDGAYFTTYASYRFYNGSAFAARTKPTRLAAGFANVFKMMAPGRTSITIPTQDNAASDLMLPSQRYWLFQYN